MANKKSIGEMSAESRLSVVRKGKKSQKMVEGVFNFYSQSLHDVLSFSYCSGSHIGHYDLIPGHKYIIPKEVADYLNRKTAIVTTSQKLNEFGTYQTLTSRKRMYIFEVLREITL